MRKSSLICNLTFAIFQLSSDDLHRFVRRAVIGVSRVGNAVFGRVADGDEQTHADVFGERKRVFYVFFFESADKAASEPEVSGFEHDVSAD